MTTRRTTRRAPKKAAVVVTLRCTGKVTHTWQDDTSNPFGATHCIRCGAPYNHQDTEAAQAARLAQ